MIGEIEIADLHSNQCVADEISVLHRRCGIYTRLKTAKSILKKIGWDESNNLEGSCLLEPCAGDGSFLVIAVQELIRSFRKHKNPLNFHTLSNRIVAFEIHPIEAERARAAIVFELTTLGINVLVAKCLANKWIRSEDFLLTHIRNNCITHVVANPPYIRWRNIPVSLAKAYRSALPFETTRGDLCVAFIARIINIVSPNTRIGLLSSDRWMYAVYAEKFRSEWLPKVEIKELLSVNPSRAFQRAVSASPLICIMRREAEINLAGTKFTKGVESNGTQQIEVPSSPQIKIRQFQQHSEIVTEWQRLFPLIEASGCRIKVGPALGHEPAFVGTKNELQVEQELLSPYLTAREIVGETIQWSGRWAMCVGSPGGGLVDLSDLPQAKNRLNKFKEVLEKRSCIRNEQFWFKTIDRTVPSDWVDEKVLVPELSRIPRAAYDREGFMPSHGIYAIFSDEWPTDVLWNVLSSGILRITLESIAPRVSGGSIRCYKRFLSQIPLPRWYLLSRSDRAVLTALSKQKDRSKIIQKVATIYGVNCKFLEMNASNFIV